MLALLSSHDIKNLEYEGTQAVISEFLSVIVFVTILWFSVFKTLTLPTKYSCHGETNEQTQATCFCPHI